METVVDLGPAQEFREGIPERTEVDGREFAVLRWGDEAYVFRNVCPHMNAPLARGMCLSRVVRDGVGLLGVDSLAPVIVCPWHRWEFSLSSNGVSLRDDRFSVKMYRAWIDQGRLMADLPLRRRKEAV
jgi:nitrite reductase (NADH) small subunit